MWICYSSNPFMFREHRLNTGASGIKAVIMLYRCEHENCNLVFDRPSKLVRHQNLHMGIRSYPCLRADCGKTYSTPSHLKRHIITHHVPSIEKKNSIFCCSFQQCDALFNTLWGLRRHEMKHENSYYCENCKLYFRNVTTFEKHKSGHKRKSKRECSHCGKSFADKKKSDWIAHENRCMLRSGREVLSYECSRCSSRFQIKKRLTSHISECFSLPTPASSLFLCGEHSCFKMFAYKRNLIAHIRRDHLKVLYSCSIPSCGKIFKHRKYWLRHEKLHRANYWIHLQGYRYRKFETNLSRQSQSQTSH